MQMNANELAEVIHKARWPEGRQMAVTPFADEDAHGREYCLRIAREVSKFYDDFASSAELESFSSIVQRCMDMLDDIPGETLEKRLVHYIGNHMALQVEAQRICAQLTEATRLIHHAKSRFEQLTEQFEALDRADWAMCSVDAEKMAKFLGDEPKQPTSPNPVRACDRLNLTVEHWALINPDAFQSRGIIEMAVQDIARLATEVANLRADRDRIERNRDMWKGQCERQATQLTEIRAAAPVAWLYEAITTGDSGHCYWAQCYSDTKPSDSKWIRNIRPLYLAADRTPVATIDNTPSCGQENDYRRAGK